MKTNPMSLENRFSLLVIFGLAMIFAIASAQSVSAQQWTGPDGNGNISNANSGNVGIGTTNLSGKVHIKGRASAWSLYGEASDGSQLYGFYEQSTGTGQLQIMNASGTAVISLAGDTGTASFINAGSVGIGTTSPTGALQVQGSGQNDTLRVISTNTTSGGLYSQNTQAGAQAVGYFENNRGSFASYGGFLYGGSTNAIGNLFGVSRADKMFMFADGGSNLGMAVGTLQAQPLIFGTNNAERARIDSSGNVGIGTTGPAVRLDVAAASSDAITRVGQFYQPGLSTTGNYSFISVGKANAADSAAAFGFLMNAAGNDSAFVTVAGDDPAAGTGLFVRKGGSVGIGTSAPAYKLDVNGAINATGLNVNGSAVTGSQWTTSGSNINYPTSGNVGIGTSSPTYKLHVTGSGKFTGDLTVDGNIAARYQDVAEWVPSSEQLPAGTVVVLDATKSNQVIASATSYDTRVAGVISEQPGIALGEKSDNKVLVATTGRVRVKVDASRAPIGIGDLLVTSDIPGVAMKSEPVNLGGVQIHRPGTLIGKALEPLEKGSGTILVLLSLQ